MRLVEILEALNIPLVVRNEVEEARLIGSAPDGGAQLVWEDQPVVWTRWAERDWVRREAVDGILHEAVHAVVGPRSLCYETAVMALQWSLLSELVGEERASARYKFAMYSLGRGRDVGDGDRFVRLRRWRDMVWSACKLGVLAGSDGRPVWGIGAHPGWERFVASERCEEA